MGVVRTYDDELKYIEKLSEVSWRIKKGFVPNMKVNHQIIFSCFNIASVYVSMLTVILYKPCVCIHVG